MSRLREAFNDPLFIRERYGLTPTEHCIQIGEKLPLLMDDLEQLFQPSRVFEPAAYEGLINISLTNALTSSIGKPLFARLKEKAPNARYQIMDWNWQTESALLSGKLQLAISYGPDTFSKLIRQEKLPENNYIICVRKGHPLTQIDVCTLNELARYPMVLIRTPDWRSRHELAEEVLINAGYVPEVLLKSDSVSLNFDAIRQTDAFFPMASSTHELPDDVEILSLSGDIPTSNMDIYAYYLYQTRDSSLVKWIVSELKQVISG